MHLICKEVVTEGPVPFNNFLQNLNRLSFVYVSKEREK